MLLINLHGPRCEKPYLTDAYNKGIDQPAHTHRFISIFVIHFLESTISSLASGEISIFLLVSVAEEIYFSLTL